MRAGGTICESMKHDWKELKSSTLQFEYSVFMASLFSGESLMVNVSSTLLFTLKQHGLSLVEDRKNGNMSNLNSLIPDI
jgi:hypothetical protein